MPLMPGKYKKAFSKNVETEMDSGKPQKQALAIAYSVKRKPKKKMARGGMVNESAASERRPMPEEQDKDAAMVSRNIAKKPLIEDDWTDQPTVRQAQKPSITPLKHPKMVPQSAYSVRMRNLEDDLMSSARPGPYGEQPPKEDDEIGPMRQGPKVPDMQDSHSTKRKPYAKGGEVQNSDYGHKANKYEDDLTDLEPSHDEGHMMADHMNEEGPDRQGPMVPDMEDEHTTARRPYAEGGTVQFHEAEHNEDHDMDLNPAHDKHSADDSEMQPMDEEEEEHHNSIAAAIMAKRNRDAMELESGSKDEDRAERDEDDTIGKRDGIFDMDSRKMYAKGGEIKSHPSIYSTNSSEVDLSRNADEDANEEDQLSFNALRKENYSESEGLRQLDQPMDSNLHGDDEEMDSHDKHDMISSIRSKMKSRKQFR